MTTPMLAKRYRIIRELAAGGFGRTFLAEDTQMPSGRKCIIKMLKPIHNNPQIYQLVQERFHLEAAILEELGENNNQIPRLYGKFEEAGRFYLVEEWIQGQTLGNIQAQVGIASENLVKNILLSILPVLQYIHSKGIIHRDIKPDNIILRITDNLPVLIDFGAVKETMGSVMSNSGNVTSSIVIGTPGFMPSEQAAGRPLFASDLYSLALTAIYLLTGKFPQELETNQLTGEILWQKHAYNVSPSFAAILDKAIHFSARERYMNAPAMLSALQAISPPSMSPQPPSGGSYSSTPTIPSIPPPGSGMVGGGGTFNTSVPVPPEISGWNWGAALTFGLWSFTNKVWIGLLVLVSLLVTLIEPWSLLFGIFILIVLPLVLGAKGNVWAWRSRQWRSVQDFKSHQRAWAKAGIIIFPVTIVLYLIALGWRYGDPPPPDPNPSPTVSTSPSLSPSPTEPSLTFSKVEIGNLESYTYDNGLFSIDVPQGWTRQDNSKSGEVVVWWLDSTKNGLIQVNVFAAEGNQTPEQLGKMLQNILNSWYKSQPNFSIDQPVTQPNGSVRITWSYTATANNGGKGEYIGNSFISQQGDKIAILTISVPQEQYKRLLPTINQIIHSYQVNPSAPLP